MCGVRDSSPARWLPSRGQRLPLGACGGTAMRPHATLRPRLTSNTSHTSVPSPLTVPFTHPAPHLLAEPTRSSDHWRRRRGEKATAEAEESTVFAAVGGARRNGAASPERLQIEGNARSHSHNPCLHFSPLTSVFDASLEIRRDSGDLAMRRRSRRRRSPVLAVFGGTGQFRRGRGGGIVGVVMPVRRHALVFPMDWAGVSRFV